MQNSRCDILVIGAGMAGASIAAQLAKHATVRLLEMEERPGYHSTGRSAALFSESYGNSVIRALTRASRSFFFSPPSGFCTTPLVRPRSVLIIAQTGQRQTLEALLGSTLPGDQRVNLSPKEALQLCPVLRTDDLCGALLDGSPADIEVHELHDGYLRLFKARGGAMTTRAEVVALECTSSGWLAVTASEVIEAAIIVNAAGAWASELGRLAGAYEIGLTPCRRTAILIDPPSAVDIDTWPMLLDIEEQFYLKPDAGLLLLSPGDETPSPPCDTQPDELDVAIAVDRLQQATTLQVSRLRRKWAGLRSFVRDRSPVVGYDPVQRGFFWHAALGGYGIQTAPALSSLAASLVLGRPIDDAIANFGVDAAALGPSRLWREEACDPENTSTVHA